MIPLPDLHEHLLKGIFHGLLPETQGSACVQLVHSLKCMSPSWGPLCPDHHADGENWTLWRHGMHLAVEDPSQETFSPLSWRAGNQVLGVRWSCWVERTCAARRRVGSIRAIKQGEADIISLIRTMPCASALAMKDAIWISIKPKGTERKGRYYLWCPSAYGFQTFPLSLSCWKPQLHCCQHFQAHCTTPRTQALRCTDRKYFPRAEDVGYIYHEGVLLFSDHSI